MKNNTVRALLTVSSCIGVAGTALMAVRDTKKCEKLPEFEGEKDIFVYFKRKIRDYVPTMIVGGATIGCIVTNHVLTAKEIKALTTVTASAAALLEKYKQAVEEEFGKEGAEKVIRNVANKRFRETGKMSGTELLTENGSELFFMEHSDTFFRSSKTKVLSALYEFNKEFAENKKIPVDRLHDMLEIEPNIQFCDNDFGFSHYMMADEARFIDFDLVEAESDSGEPFTIIYFARQPGLYNIDLETYADLD